MPERVSVRDAESDDLVLSLKEATVFHQAAADEVRLRALWSKHVLHSYRKPISDHTRDVFNRHARRLKEASDRQSMILDSGCGTARSTRMLAERFADCLVVGVDRSAARLSSAPNLPDNALCLRAELSDFWRLCHEHSLRFRKHFVLYPNPYPKSEHLLRRWHAHPVFSTMLDLSAELELRTNMPWYAREWSCVLSCAGWTTKSATLDLNADILDHEAMSAFERKYGMDGQTLWQVVAHEPVRAKLGKNP